MAIQGGEVMADAARAVGKRPLPIPPSRKWFALLFYVNSEALNEANVWAIPLS